MFTETFPGKINHHTSASPELTEKPSYLSLELYFLGSVIDNVFPVIYEPGLIPSTKPFSSTLEKLIAHISVESEPQPSLSEWATQNKTRIPLRSITNHLGKPIGKWFDHQGNKDSNHSQLAPPIELIDQITQPTTHLMVAHRTATVLSTFKYPANLGNLHVNSDQYIPTAVIRKYPLATLIKSVQETQSFLSLPINGPFIPTALTRSFISADEISVPMSHQIPKQKCLDQLVGWSMKNTPDTGAHTISLESSDHLSSEDKRIAFDQILTQLLANGSQLPNRLILSTATLKENDLVLETLKAISG